MYWCLTRTGLYLSVEYYVICVNLLFSNSRVQSYIKRGRLLDLRTEVQTVPSDEDVGHVGNGGMLYTERVRREQAVGARLLNTGDVM